jgi:hypothetical protein
MEQASEKDGQLNFSNDQEQNLRIENELLKIKLQAEHGAWFDEFGDDLPPELEAEFLRNVQLFEDSFDKGEEMSIYECIGKPEYKNVNGLTADEIDQEMERVLELLHSKNILLDVSGEYEPAIIYKFITDELFHEKIREINIPGFMHHFIYEEFHPDHKADMGRTAQKFLDHWFEKGFDENSFELAHQLLTEDGKIFSRDEVITKLHNCLNSYHKFSNIEFIGCDTRFEWNEEKGIGLGHAEGMFRYDAELENRETLHFEGRFMLYMFNQDGFWQIFYFVFPGFAW